MEKPEHPMFEACIRGVGGAAVGLGVGVLCILVGLLGAAVAMLGGVPVRMVQIWPAAGLYLLGFAAGGAAMAALWPDEPHTARQYVAGAIGGVVMMAFMARITDGAHAAWSLRTYLVVVLLGSVFGMAFTRGLRRSPASGEF